MKPARIDWGAVVRRAKEAAGILERLSDLPLLETDQEREILAFNFRDIADELDPATQRDLAARKMREAQK